MGGGAPGAVWWLPLAVAMVAFALNQVASYRAQLRARWNVAINVHREATEACVSLPRFARNFALVVPRRLFAGEKLFFLDDGSQGGVFNAFGADIKMLPPSLAAAALLYFERYAFLSAMLLKIETAAMDRLSLQRQLALVDDLVQAVEATARAAERTRVLAKLYLRGRYVPLLRTAPSARLALAVRADLRAVGRRFRAWDRRERPPGLTLPATPWRPEIAPDPDPWRRLR